MWIFAQVMPSDPNFCNDCNYLIGVYGWSNTSFTITAVVEKMFIIPLSQGRPQSGNVAKQDMRYFSIALGNSAEDLNVMVTTLTGKIDLYVADHESENLPNIHDPSTYQYTTKGKTRDRLSIPGPHPNRSTFIIGVYGTEESDFALTASLSQNPVMLQEGVPMQQSVSAGQTEFFSYRINSDADIIITATAIQGDPDLLASTTYEKPHCVSGGDWNYRCANYTWISQSLASDQLVILHDLPCEGVGHTHVGDDCTPDMIKPGGILYIGVYGYGEATFSITVTTGGGHTNLIHGKPQHGKTRTGVICEDRNPGGSCKETDKPLENVEVAYYRFTVSPDEPQDNAHVSIVIEPECNKTVVPCGSGCACNPLSVYVKSCLVSECTIDDGYPSNHRGRYDVMHTADAMHNTIFITHDPNNPGEEY